MKRSIPALIMLATLTVAAHGRGGGRVAAPGARPQGERLAPPPSLGCARDDTTSFTGRVLSYSRGRGRVRLRVRTDEETTERFTLAYGRGGPESIFLLRGERFAAEDWRRIETRAGRLRPGVRVTVWACYAGDHITPRLIDWRPAER
jgi:hypothetical protein